MRGRLATEPAADSSSPPIAIGGVRQIRLASLLLGAAMLLSGGLLLHWLTDMTFWRDEWDFLLNRRGFSADAIMRPNYEHIVVLPVLIYKTLIGTFGISSPRPFQIASVTTFLTSVGVLFVWMRRRVGDWLALAGVMPLLFFGPSSVDLLWPFQIGFCGSVATGIGALLALERSDQLGDRIACALLVLSTLFGSLGLAFIAGALVHLAWDRDRWRRVYVVAVPIGLFVIWWLGWGHQADSNVSLHNLASSPSYVLDGFASGISSLLGLATPRDYLTVSPLDWGIPLLVLAGALAALRLQRVGAVWRGLAVAAAVALAFWLLAALNASLFREPTADRYQYMGAIFVLMIGAELLRGIQVGWKGLAAVFLVAGAATASNFTILHQYGSGLAGLGQPIRGDLAGLETARDTVDPSFKLTTPNSGVDYLGLVAAGSYFSAVDAHGSPAYSISELSTAPESARAAADRVLWNALPATVEPAWTEAAGPPPRLAAASNLHATARRSCLFLKPVGPARAVIALPPGGALLRSRRPDSVTSLHLRRFTMGSFPIDAGRLGGPTSTLRIPIDRSSRHWQLQLSDSQPITVCGLRP